MTGPELSAYRFKNPTVETVVSAASGARRRYSKPTKEISVTYPQIVDSIVAKTYISSALYGISPMTNDIENGQRNAKLGVAYFRTSSAANIGEGKDSLRRQQEAVASYAKRNRITITEEFYDAAVSGGDHISARKGFSALLERISGNDVGVVLVEDPTRFARDLIVQMTGHEVLKRLGVELVPANAPDFFREDSATAKLIRSVLGAISEFEKAQLVQKLKGARDRKRAATGRCEGRKAVPADVVKEAKRLARKSPRTGERRSLREISAALAASGHTVLIGGEPSGRQYWPQSIKRMLAA